MSPINFLACVVIGGVIGKAIAEFLVFLFKKDDAGY